MKSSRLLSRLHAQVPRSPSEICARDIERIVNAKKGYSAGHPNFGLGDYEAWLGEELWLELTQEIQRALVYSLPALAPWRVALPWRNLRGALVFAIDADSKGENMRWWLTLEPRWRTFSCTPAYREGSTRWS